MKKQQEREFKPIEVWGNNLVANLWWELGNVVKVAANLSPKTMQLVYGPDHILSVVYGEMVDLIKSDQGLTSASLQTTLSKRGIDIRAWLRDLQDLVTPDDLQTIVGYANEINNAGDLIRAHRTAQGLLQATTNDDARADQVLGEAITSLAGIGRTSETSRSFAAIASEFEEELRKIRSGEIDAGNSTGFLDLDHFMRLEPQKLVIVGGRPSQGKSALAFQIALNEARRIVKMRERKQVLINSLEMSGKEVLARLASIEASVNYERIKRRQAEDEEWSRYHRAVDELSNLPIVVDDEAGMSIDQIYFRALMRHAEVPLSMIVTDYADLVSVPGNDPETIRMRRVARFHKNLAKNLNCTTILLTQLNKAVDYRDDKRPTKADLQYAGEAEADTILLMLNPEHYLLTGETIQCDDDYRKGVTLVIVAKNRGGIMGVAPLRFERQYTRFGDLYRGN